jgi:UDP-N-acetylglucosamine pyrophosphorylase
MEKLFSITPVLQYSIIPTSNTIENQTNKQESLMKNKVAVVILAAGMGTRMKSDKAKVLHEIAGQPMIIYVVAAALKLPASP